jgi:predicted Zn-dependent protease
MIIGVILTVAALAYQTFFRPDPKVIAHMGYVQEAQTAAEQNDFGKALQALERGLVEFPGDGEIHIWQGAMLTRLNRQQEAEAAFAAARPAYADETTYLVTRSNIRLQAGDPDGAYADAQAAVRADPDSAQAYLMLGGAQEVRGEISAASQSYSTAAGLAAARKDTQLEAMAKVRLAMMMQSAPVFPQATAIPTR